MKNHSHTMGRFIAIAMTASFLGSALVAGEKTDTTAPVREVTIYNYVRAESDRQFAGYAKLGAFGRIHHNRKAYDIDHQITIRANRDTLYSFGVFDLEAAPVTIILPDTHGRYMSLHMINEDHYMKPVMYAPGTYKFSKRKVGTRYVLFIIRTFADPNDPADMKAAHALQDQIVFKQKRKGKLELPNWDEKQIAKLREALQVLTATVKDSSALFGWKGEVDPISHLMGAAVGWGGLPKEAAFYVNVTPEKNDGKTPYVLNVPQDVPIDGFWSVTVYNKQGFMEKNPYNAYSFNNVTARKNPDGSVTIHFGGDPKADNFLPITDGWNYIVRLYRPRKEILSGEWKFPAPQPVE
jgi:hypothetical protein